MFNKTKYSSSFGGFVIFLFMLIVFISTIISEEITSYAKESLRLCTDSVIPSLFPFMVLSSMGCKVISSVSDTASSKLSFALSFILGSLCGFPIGASTIANLYSKDSEEKYQAEKMCAFCNNAGPSFVITVIGGNFWRNYNIGTMFYICQLVSSVIVMLISEAVFGKKKTRSKRDLCKRINHKKSPVSCLYLTEIFCSSVTSSVTNIMNICGYIIFFKVLCDSIYIFMPEFALRSIVYSLLSSVLEFTTGAYNSAILGGYTGIAICGFTVGFSGLSVIFQTSAILSKAGLSSLPMLRYKFLIGIVSSVLSVIAYTVIPFTDTVSAVLTTECHTVMKSISYVVILSGLLLKIITLKNRLRLYVKNT